MFKDYITERQLRKRGNNNVFPIVGGVNISVLSSCENVDVNKVSEFLRKQIPVKFWEDIDGVYVADIDEFRERQINALYKDGCIYVSPNQETAEDMLDDIIHELAHALEESNYDLIYGDGSLEKEFLEKRSRFWDLLNTTDKKLLYKLLSPEFQQDLDEFFHSDIGYDEIENMIGDKFCSPYGITSLREYWANCFEHFYFGDVDEVREKCPSCFRKLVELKGS